MTQNFSYSTSNKIYLGVVALASIALAWPFSSMDARQSGQITGGLIALILIPTLIAWVVWRLAGKNERAGSVTFNILLTLILLSKLVNYGKEVQKIKELQSLQEHKVQFKNAITGSTNVDESNAAYSEFTDSVKDSIHQLSETSTGKQKRFYQIVGEIVAESEATVQNWNQSFEAVHADRILDYSVLTSDEEFKYQKIVLARYIDETKAYRDFLANSVPNLKKRLKVLGDDCKIAKGAIDGATNKYRTQKPIFDPLMQAHIDYGNNMIAILNFLQQNKSEWIFEDDQLAFYSDEMIDGFNALVEELAVSETSVNLFTEKLAPVL